MTGDDCRCPGCGSCPAATAEKEQLEAAKKAGRKRRGFSMVNRALESELARERLLTIVDEQLGPFPSLAEVPIDEVLTLVEHALWSVRMHSDALALPSLVEQRERVARLAGKRRRSK